ncbi:hypothetical protein [Roseobacter weihaiensis]|uniref:hypothetical protein n=1 Tax=Roseobacter weihaiensis TaxID=2763262 RepID=UPI001D0AD442|nr:hypothetical protein [Roseobacter sp. H9]
MRTRPDPCRDLRQRYQKIDRIRDFNGTSINRLASTSAVVSLGFNIMSVPNGYLMQHAGLPAQVVAEVAEMQFLGFGLTVISSQ